MGKVCFHEMLINDPSGPIAVKELSNLSDAKITPKKYFDSSSLPDGKLLIFYCLSDKKYILPFSVGKKIIFTN